MIQIILLFIILFMKNKYLTIDIGGTKIELCKFDQNFKLVESKQISTAKLPVKSMAFIDELKKIIADNLEPDIEKIGISFNAAINNGMVLYSSLLGGEVNYPLEKEFSQEFGKQVKLQNDVNAMAIAESKIGKGKDLQSFVLLNLGSGVKLSFISNGRLITGFNGIAGEISQKEIIVSELNNQVFKIDDLVSGKGLQNIYKELTGKELAAQDIFAVTDNNPEAQKAIEIFIKYLSQLLAEISYFYNPEKIIINGSLKKSADKFLAELSEQYKQKTLNIFHFKAIEFSNMDQSAGLGCILD